MHWILSVETGSSASHAIVDGSMFIVALSRRTCERKRAFLSATTPEEEKIHRQESTVKALRAPECILGFLRILAAMAVVSTRVGWG